MAGVHHQVSRHSTTPDQSSQSVAIQIAPTERTPLIGKKPVKNAAASSKKSVEYCDFKIILIALLMLAGMAIASYLLIIDTRIRPIHFAFDLVSRDAWSAFPYAFLGNKILDASNVVHVIVFHTRGDDCNDLESCVLLLRTMESSLRSENAEIPYNFMIGGDGQIYECNGWNHVSDLNSIPQETSLVIGFIGNFTESAPPPQQLKAGSALIQESLHRKKIRPDYHVYGFQNLTISHSDGNALFREISDWIKFDTLLKVL